RFIVQCVRTLDVLIHDYLFLGVYIALKSTSNPILRPSKARWQMKQTMLCSAPGTATEYLRFTLDLLWP
ncbi:MAG: hypothetical protein OEM91_12560, partial [Hyphomicrobiales bacterium]|nr:hypothetical protein [Hyphomicrobiales bacterium]